MGKAKHRRKSRRRTLRRLLAALALAFFAYQAVTWPSVRALAKQNPKTTAFIERYKARQKKAHQGAAVAWRWVSYDRISGNLKRAVLVAEDINFFSHRGFDLGELQIAVKESALNGDRLRGASTLTQQTAKNLWLSPSHNPWRKVKEALLTAELEYFLSKSRILEIYLNVAEFGPGVYGAEAAAKHYFHKSADRLTASEAAQLAASLPKPSKWHPGSPSQAYNKRVPIILERMEKAEFLKKRLRISEPEPETKPLTEPEPAPAPRDSDSAQSP